MKTKKDNKHKEYLKILGQIDNALEDMIEYRQYEMEFGERSTFKIEDYMNLTGKRKKILNEIIKTKEFSKENIKILENFSLDKINEISKIKEDDIELSIIKKYYTLGYNKEKEPKKPTYKDFIKEIGKIDNELEELKEISFFAAEFSEQTSSLENSYKVKQTQRENTLEKLENTHIFTEETLQILKQNPGYLRNFITKETENDKQNIELVIIKNYYMQGYKENEEYKQMQKEKIKKMTKMYNRKHK